MNPTTHCKLCDRELFDIIEGSRCGLTNRPADFQGKCPDILLGKKCEKTVKAVNLDHEMVLIKKADSYGSFVLFGILGTVLVVGGPILGVDWFGDWWYLEELPLAMIGIGGALLVMGIRTLRSYESKIKTVAERKEAMDEALSTYQIDYTINIKVHKDSFGTKGSDIDLSFRKKGK